MTKRRFRQFKLARKLAIILAAAPLFQLGQCQTGVQQVFASVANGLPSTLFYFGESLALLPLQLILFPSSGNNNNNNNGGIGNNNGGLGGNGGIGI